ncbi:MAG: membrane protein insertase YidC [Chloroflexi bacterium]|nr:membrane protein insertase YidC [Chloroflexota bacterium]
MGIIIDVLSTILLVLYGVLGQNVFLAIVAFTVIIRLAILPLTLKQQRSMKKMQELAPKLRQLQQKYKDDRERLAQEQMKMYRENGVNPFAGCLPLLIQLPILFGLWRAIIATLASSPEQLLELQDRLLISGLDHLVPMNNTFLWLNLALPDPYFVLPVFVVITTYIQQKMLMPLPEKKDQRKSNEPPDPAEQAQQMTRSMTTIMPLVLGFVALSYSSGLAIYFITSNVIGIIQYSAMGKADIRRLFGQESAKTKEERAKAKSATTTEDAATGDDDEEIPQTERREAGMVAATEAAVAGPSRQLKPGISITTLKPNPPSNERRSSGTSGASASKKPAKKSSSSGSRPRKSKKSKSRSRR